MWALSTAKKEWYPLAKAALESHGFTLIVQKQSIIATSKNLRVPHVINSEREFIDYAVTYGAKIDVKAATADRESTKPVRRPAPPDDTTAQSASGRSNPAPSSVDDRADLLAKIERLRSAGKTVIEQRDAWQKRALAAEARVAELAAILAELQGGATGEKKFDEMKRYLARELHPDHSTSDGIEKLIRSEMFKKIWPKVEEIARSRA
jgi:hypothetical protein